MKHKFLLFGITALGAVALLIFWPGEPSESDMLTALQNNAQFVMILNLSAGPGVSATAVEDGLKRAVVKKSECVRPSDRPGYVCDFQLGRNSWGKINYSPPLRGRFFKADGGWSVELN